MVGESVDLKESEIFQVDRALESWRDSGFDLSTAVGEVVDNSIEARAQIVRIKTFQNQDKNIDKIVFADNGTGITPDILAQTLKIGFSTRYNQRNGLGRFGVGMKVAALSQGRRLDVYSKPMGHSSYYHAFLDLNMIASGEQTHIIATKIEHLPLDLSDMMMWSDGSSFESGTLIVWSDIDRLVNETTYGNSAKESLQELTKFLARAYRVQIEQGFTIEQDNRIIDLYDPLFLMESPRMIKILGESNYPATVMDRSEIELDGEKIVVTVTLLPEVVRKVSGEGGYLRSAAKYKDLNLKDRDGYISIMRNGREIQYGVIPRMLPGRIEKYDRFIGIEISFPAVLDEYFQVRNVKRGAEPVKKLKQQIIEMLEKPVRAARNEITTAFSKNKVEKMKTEAAHTPALEAVSAAEKTALPGRAGMNVTADEANTIVDDIVRDVGLNPEDSNASSSIKKQIETRPIMLVDSAWPGKELFEIVHLNGRAIVKLNHRHPFIKDIYLPIKEIASSDPNELEITDISNVVGLVQSAIDVLFMAYAKAENLHSNPDSVYSDLRSQWGYFTAAYVRELKKNN